MPNRLSEQEMSARLDPINVKIHEDYSNQNDRITFECLVCNTTFKTKLYDLLAGKSRPCKCGKQKKFYIIEEMRINKQKIGMLLPIKYLGRQGYFNRHRWLFLCDCGKNKEIEIQELLRTDRKSYTSCGCNQSRPKHKGYKEISTTTWNCILRCATIRDLEINITIEYIWTLFLKQNKRCALSGVEICFSTTYKNRRDKTASLDRIDSTKGYIVGNVQWVHKDINIMKMDYDQEYFIQICNKIAKQHPRNQEMKEF